MIAVERLELQAGPRVLMAPASFTVQSGEFIALLGRNGSGKTTLLRTLAGVRRYAYGSIRIAGRDLSTMGAPERAALISHLAGDDVFFDKLLVREVAAMGRYAHHRWWQWRRTQRDDEVVDAALEAAGMLTFASRAFDTLSSGERQRVWIALALAQESPLLLLDEPTSHLDIRSAQEILLLLKTLCGAGKTIVCALHDLNEAAQTAGKVLLLGSGKLLAFDTPHRVFAGRSAQEAYGVPLESFTSPSGALRVFPAQSGSVTIDRGFE
ncbi:MAG: ABC transporter ATP-binding protein [Candidatus Baltobacteraceae bacterium]